MFFCTSGLLNSENKNTDGYEQCSIDNRIKQLISVKELIMKVLMYKMTMYLAKGNLWLSREMGG